MQRGPPTPSSFVNSKFYANSKESINLSLGEQLDLGEKLMEIHNLVFARVSGEQHCVKTSIEAPPSNNAPFQQHYRKFSISVDHLFIPQKVFSLFLQHCLQRPS